MVLFAGLGVVMTAASAQIVGETISDPITLIGKIDSPFWVVLSMIIIIIATISTNTAANIVSPTNDFQNVAPRLINQKRGVLLTGFIGIALMSWELLKRMGWLHSDVSVDSLYSNWLLGYSSLLGPIAGIMVVDYFVVRRQHYDLPGLYLDPGPYPAWNVAGFVAFSRACGVHADRDHHGRAAVVLHLRMVHGLVPRRDHYYLEPGGMQKSAVAPLRRDPGYERARCADT